MFGLPIEKLHQFSDYKDAVRKQTEALQKDEWDANFAMVFGNVMIITSVINRQMELPYGLLLWEYGLDEFYIENELFRRAYDRWCSEGEYAGLTFETYLDKCGLTLAELRAAQIVTERYTSLQVGENTLVSSVGG